VAQVRAVALNVTKVGIGILGFALFMWTPATGKGILVFFGLLVVLIVLAAVLTKYKGKEHESYGPGG
jgi:hypothetical protein